MQDLTVLLFQEAMFWEDPSRNRERWGELLQAHAGQAEVIVLPEMFTTGFTVHPERVAEPADGPTLEWMRARASEVQAALAGSYIVEDQGRYFNRLVWVNPDGNIASYDKRHLFRMGGEHERFGMGEKRTVVEYLGWKFLPLVCYDLRFPVWSRNRLLEGRFEYDVLIYVANWPAARAHPWKALLVARAIENQCYTIGVNRVGTDGEGITYSGDSCIVDPRGQVSAHASPGQARPLTHTLEAKVLQEFREKFQVSLDWDRFSVPGTGLQ